MVFVPFYFETKVEMDEPATKLKLINSKSAGTGLGPNIIGPVTSTHKWGLKSFYKEKRRPLFR